MGLTEACTELWGEGPRAGPIWTSFLSSQCLKLRAEVCRKLPERSEDKDVTGSQRVDAQDETFLGPEDRMKRWKTRGSGPEVKGDPVEPLSC